MKNTQQFEIGKIVPSNAEVLRESADEIRLECYSLGKEFGWAAKEFCRLREELYRLGKEFYSTAKESCRVRKQFGQAAEEFCRLAEEFK